MSEKHMNRQERRAFAKNARRNGISKEGIEAYLAAQESGFKNPRQSKDFKEGDKVLLDLESIKSHTAYENMTQSYKNFVESNADRVFTAHIEKDDLISFKEQPEWLFWSGDLTEAKEGET